MEISGSQEMEEALERDAMDKVQSPPRKRRKTTKVRDC
jgi:hypothetical protein